MIVTEKIFTETSIKKVAAGNQHEKGVAFQLRRAFGSANDIFVFNDFAFSHGVENAQIDHMIVHRHGFVIVESKSIYGELRVNSRGEFSRSYNGKWTGMASPIEQAKLQVELLKDLLRENCEQFLGKLFNIQKKGVRNFEYHSLCAVSSSAIIHRNDMPDYIDDKLYKTEFVADRVSSLMNLKKGVLSKLVHISQERLWLSDTELFDLVEFLKGVDKSNQSQEVRPAIKPVVEVAPEIVTAPSVIEASAEAHNIKSCKTCKRSDTLTAGAGKYGYYWSCSVCKVNTPMKSSCPSCLSKSTKVSKSKSTFTLSCEDCKNELVIDN